MDEIWHHCPYFGGRSEEDGINLRVAFDVVQTMHEIEFGRKMVSVWGITDAL